MKTIVSALLAVIFTLTCKSQTILQHYESNSGYSFDLPSNFKSNPTNRQSTDFNFLDEKNRLITLQTFARTPAEKGVNAHQFTKAMLQESYSRADSETMIYLGEKIYVGGEKAFKACFSNSICVSKCEVTIYKGEKVYLFTLCSKLTDWKERGEMEQIFQNFIESLKFQSI